MNKAFWIVIGFYFIAMVSLKAEVAEGRGSWIKVHEVKMEDCVKSGGVHENDMDWNTTVCHIQDFRLKNLLKKEQ